MTKFHNKSFENYLNSIPYTNSIWLVCDNFIQINCIVSMPYDYKINSHGLVESISNWSVFCPGKHNFWHQAYIYEQINQRHNSGNIQMRHQTIIQNSKRLVAIPMIFDTVHISRLYCTTTNLE